MVMTQKTGNSERDCSERDYRGEQSARQETYVDKFQAAENRSPLCSLFEKRAEKAPILKRNFQIWSSWILSQTPALSGIS
jgi:hypothetical protein